MDGVSEGYKYCCTIDPESTKQIHFYSRYDMNCAVGPL